MTCYGPTSIDEYIDYIILMTRPMYMADLWWQRPTYIHHDTALLSFGPPPSPNHGQSQHQSTCHISIVFWHTIWIRPPRRRVYLQCEDLLENLLGRSNCRITSRQLTYYLRTSHTAHSYRCQLNGWNEAWLAISYPFPRPNRRRCHYKMSLGKSCALQHLSWLRSSKETRSNSQPSYWFSWSNCLRNLLALNSSLTTSSTNNLSSFLRVLLLSNYDNTHLRRWHIHL